MSSISLEDKSWKRSFLRNQPRSSNSCANELSENGSFDVQCVNEHYNVLKMQVYSP